MRIPSKKFIVILVVFFLISILSVGAYIAAHGHKSITLTPQFTVITVYQNDTIFALSDFNKSQGTYLWNVTFTSGNFRKVETVNTFNYNVLKIKSNKTGEYAISLNFSVSQMHIRSNVVHISVLNKSSNLRISSNLASTNLTSPVTFFVSRLPYNSSRVTTGFEWFVDGTPLQNYAGPTATVLFQKAGVYSVYAEAILYNGSSIISNAIQIQVTSSGFWNGSDMAAIGGYFVGPMLVHTPLNYSNYILWNGPGVYLPYGEYQVSFTMAISNITGSNYSVISLEVQGSVNSTSSIYFTKNIVRGNFHNPNEFTTFTMTFNQTFHRNVGFNFMGVSASTNLTIYLRCISLNHVGAQNIQNGSNLTIETYSKSTNLTTSVNFSIVCIPADYKELVTGFEWFVDGTPLQNYAGPTATVLFQKAGVYSVYAEATTGVLHRLPVSTSITSIRFD